MSTWREINDHFRRKKRIVRRNEKGIKYSKESALSAENMMPGETKVIPTGLKVAIPEGYELQVRPRSGLSLKTPLRIANAPGTIDSGYRGEIGVIISNMTPISADYCSTYSVDETGGKPGIYEIKKGDRIAQIVLCRYETMEFEVVEEGRVQTLGLNRGGGFGSTGIH